MWKWMGQFLRKNHILRCCCWLSLLNWIGALALSLLLNLTPRKLEPWFVLWSFFLLKWLCISINLPYTYVWNAVVMSGLMLLVFTWNCWISYKNRYTGLLGLHLLPLEPLSHHQNVASWSLFYRCYFVRGSAELAELVPLPYCWGRSTCYSDILHDLSVTIPRCYKDVYFNSFFPCTARLSNSLPLECFLLTYDLSGFTSRINWHLLTVGSFYLDFVFAVTILWFFFL